jgi:hypothetical protein
MPKARDVLGWLTTTENYLVIAKDKPMTDLEINRAIDDLLYPDRVWDERKCRVCGRDAKAYGCGGSGSMCNPDDPRRADDPQPHTTDHELMARDLERLPEDKRNLFLFELRNITNDPDHQPLSKREWLMLTATLRQKCIAIRRAFGGIPDHEFTSDIERRPLCCVYCGQCEESHAL